MKNVIAIVAILSSTPAFADRLIQCEVANPTKALENEIHSIKDIAGFQVTASNRSQATVTRVAEGTKPVQKSGASYEQNTGPEQSFCLYDSTEAMVDGHVYTYTTCLVKKNPGKGSQAEWVVRKEVRILSRMSCIPHEDFQCTEDYQVVEERAAACMDSADSATNSDSNTQAAIDSDPCNPRNRGGNPN